MTFSDIVGSVSARLREEINSSRIVHAYLLTGPAGTGKRTLADICAQALLCRSDNVKPCGTCPSCQRFQTGNHPDYLHMLPTKEHGSKTYSIKIDPIRDMIAWLGTKPYEGGRHVVIIEQADKMTVEAQNALLKTLETPPGHAVFFIVTSHADAILSTIVSRCRVIRFHNLEESETIDVLEKHGIESNRARLLARLSQGSIGRALELNESESWWQLRENVLRALDKLREKRDVAIAAAPLAEDRNHAQDILDILELCARDIMIIQDSDADVIQTDIEDMLSRQKFTGSILLNAIIEARKMLVSNVSWPSVLEMLFFKMVGG